MALTIPCNTSRVVGLDEFIDYVHSSVDLRDQDSVAGAARCSAAGQRRRAGGAPHQPAGENPVPQARPWLGPGDLLGEGRDFLPRANVWPSNADIASGRVYQDQFSYHRPTTTTTTS